MNNALRLVDRAANKFAGFIPAKPHLLRNETGVISFTFDDVARSALTEAGAILARQGCAGTFYVAGGLTGALENGVPCHTVDDLEAARRDGHELASHGYTHIPAFRLGPVRMMRDIEANARFFEERLRTSTPRHYSYPLGARGRWTKAMLARRFVTARGIRPGVNRRVCDLADLKANALYARTTNEARIAALIANVASRGGWLIFYTHDVSEEPSAYGVTPALIEFAVRTAAASGCRVLPVRNAVGAVSYR